MFYKGRQACMQEKEAEGEEIHAIIENAEEKKEEEGKKKCWEAKPPPLRRHN